MSYERYKTYLNELFPEANGDFEISFQTIEDTTNSLDDAAIWKWWKTQNFQKEEGEQEYTMICYRKSNF